MLAVIFLLTASVLVLVQARMRKQLKADLAATLQMESHLYGQMESMRREQSRRSTELIANQPIVKALVSTNDRLTVQDGSQSILETSHADLLILQNLNGEILGLHSKTGSAKLTAATVQPLLRGTDAE